MRSDDSVKPCRTHVGIGINHQLIERRPNMAAGRVDQVQATVQALFAALIACRVFLRRALLRLEPGEAVRSAEAIGAPV